MIISKYRQDLINSQMEEWPDSVILTIEQALAIHPGNRSVEKMGQYFKWVSFALSYLQYGPVQFYICGKNEGGSYRWLGMRYGLKPEEYFSGCPLNDLRFMLVENINTLK